MSGEWEVTAKLKPKNRLETLVERVQQLRRLRQWGLEDLCDAAALLNAANDEIKQLETDKQTLLNIIDGLDKELKATRLRAQVEARYSNREVQSLKSRVERLRERLRERLQPTSAGALLAAVGIKVSGKDARKLDEKLKQLRAKK